MTSRLYGAANPNLVELAKEARERLPVSIVTTLFHLSSTMIGSRQFSDQALLSILGMISSVLDAEAPALKNVPGRAWLGRIVKALPSVSDCQAWHPDNAGSQLCSCGRTGFNRIESESLSGSRTSVAGVGGLGNDSSARHSEFVMLRQY